MKQGSSSNKRPPVQFDWKKRLCLKCGKKFDSEGNHHRICNDCKSRHDWKTGSDLHN